MSALEKIIRLSGQQAAEPPPDDIRVLVQSAHLALTEACETGDPAQMAELVYASQAVLETLAATLFTGGMPDWVEATSAPPDGAMLLALGGDALGDGSKPYGNVSYADPGYQGDKRKRYPTDTEEHVRSAWGYINKAKNAAKYTASQLASVKDKIKGAMKSHGIGANVTASAGDGDLPVLSQLRDGGAWVMLAGPPASMGSIGMHHAPFSGTHSHPHSVTMVHDHGHQHGGDNEHGGGMHGSNSGQKAWAAKGEAAWGAHRQSYGQDAHTDRIRFQSAMASNMPEAPSGSPAAGRHALGMSADGD